MTFENGQLFSEPEWEEIIGALSIPHRQSQVVRNILKGYSDTQIANEMEISVSTVRTHISRLFEKFEIQDRHELLLHVFRTFRKGCPEGCPRRRRR